LSYLKAELYDQRQRAFVEEKNPDTREVSSETVEIRLDANGMAANAYLLAYELLGSPEYRDIGRGVLAALGEDVKAVLLDDRETVSAAKVADSVFYLQAYGRLLAKP
jgi:hypothetical protein